MPKCHFCDHDNLVGVDRCQNCGAWIEQKAAPASTNVGQQAEPSTEPDSFEAQLLAMMEGGKKIEAIKLYRQRMGCDLKAAKDAVEALATKHGIISKGSGCAGVVLVMLLVLGGLGIGLAEDVPQSTPPTGQEAQIAADITRLENSDKNERASAMKALVKIGKPAAPGLVKVLSDPRNNVRAFAAETLRSILAVDPAAAPNYHEKAYWEHRLAQLKAGMTLDEALKLLLPKLSPAERQKRCEGGAWSGQSGTYSYRLDDYWSVHLYLIDFDHKKLHDHSPDLFRSVQKAWVAPPRDYTSIWVTWHVNGQKAHEIQYRNGKYDGTFISFYDNGPQCVQQHYTMGICDGTDTGWYRGGKKRYEGQYENNKQTGTWQWWKENGDIESTREYKNGKLAEKKDVTAGDKRLVEVIFSADDKPPTEMFHTVTTLWISEKNRGSDRDVYDWAHQGGYDAEPNTRQKADESLKLLKALSEPENLPASPNRIVTVRCVDGGQWIVKRFSIDKVPIEVHQILVTMGFKDESFKRLTFTKNP